MEDLSEYTKDYFKKSEKEKMMIFNQIYMDFLNVITSNKLDFQYVDDKLVHLENKSVENEEYEVAEMFRTIREKINKQNGL